MTALQKLILDNGDDIALAIDKTIEMKVIAPKIEELTDKEIAMFSLGFLFGKIDGGLKAGVGLN